MRAGTLTIFRTAVDINHWSSKMWWFVPLPWALKTKHVESMSMKRLAGKTFKMWCPTCNDQNLYFPGPQIVDRQFWWVPNSEVLWKQDHSSYLGFWSFWKFIVAIKQFKNETTPQTKCWQPESGIKHVLFILPVVINREIAKVTKDQYNQPIAKVMSPCTLALLCNLSSLQDVRHKIEDYLQNLQNGIWLVLLLHPLLVYCISSLTLNKTTVDIHGNS